MRLHAEREALKRAPGEVLTQISTPAELIVPSFFDTIQAAGMTSPHIHTSGDDCTSRTVQEL